jgi:transposase
MLNTEDFFMLRDLFNEGFSISEIARQTGYSRKTIKKYVTSPFPPTFRRRAKMKSKLDGYRDYITSRLQEGSFSAKSIYDEIFEMGFTGKYTIVRDFVSEIKQKSGAP